MTDLAATDTFTSFDAIANRYARRKRVTREADVTIRTERNAQRTSTIFQFGEAVVKKAGWTAGMKVEVATRDRDGRIIRVRPDRFGRYTLSGASHLSIKFTVYPGLPKVESVAAISGDGAVQVDGSEVLFLLPESVEIERMPARGPVARRAPPKTN